MYVVVSKWEALPGKEAEFEKIGRSMLATLSGWPEVEFAYNVLVSPSSVLAVIGYSSATAYQRAIEDPEGPFAKLAVEHRIEDAGRWLWSERGERMDVSSAGA